jgi:outer membrane protein TolC
MSLKTIATASQLLVLTSTLAIIPTDLQAVENCSGLVLQVDKTRCILQSPIKIRPDIVVDADNNFNAIPSCQDVNRSLDNFITSVRSMAKAISKSKTGGPSMLEQIYPGRKVSVEGEDKKSISSTDIFAKRFSISPVAKQFYFNYLQSQESTRGSFDRPFFNFQFDLDANPERSESVNGFISPIPSKSTSYTNQASPSISLSYPFSFENLYSTRSLKQQEQSTYHTFLEEAVTDAFDTVANFYDLKANMLSTILNTFQYEASVDRVNRLRRLEQKGLSSRLDISRANVTKISQETSLFSAMAALSQSYDKLAGDFLYEKDFESKIVPQIPQQGFGTACWSKPPSRSLTSALKENPSLISLRYQIESSKLKRKSIIAQNFPELSISVSFEGNSQWGNINGTGVSSDYSQTRDFIASASFNWNIFDFGQTAANAKSQSYETESLRSQLTQSRSQLETNLLTNFSAYISSTQNIVSLAKASEEATVNYINSLKASQIGILNETDVDNIFNQLTSINASLVSNIKTRNTTAVAIAKIVQTDGFDSISDDQFIIDWKRSFSK